jgi:hypothetical protein
VKWRLKLEHIDEAGILQPTLVGFIERSELTSEADLGLTREDGKYLVRQSIRNRPRSSRPIDCKGATLPLRRSASCEDHRRRRIDTVFGHLHIHAPRFKACACGAANVAGPSPSYCPIVLHLN